MLPSPGDKKHFYELLQKYEAQTANAEELAFVEAYLDHLDDRGLSAFKADELSDDAVMIQANIKQTIRTAEKRRWLAGSKIQQWTRWSAAAILLVVLGSALLYKILSTGEGGEKQPTALVVRSVSPATPVGYVRNVTLSDGTMVVLQAGSKLICPAEFGNTTRELTLVGEAYFDVAQRSGHPFIIHTGKVRTTVLGTAFNIRADRNGVRVSVTSGKVKLEDETKLLAVLGARQVASYQAAKQQLQPENKDSPVTAPAWIREQLLFDGITYGEVAALLSKRYGVSVTFSNPVMERCRIRASFKGTEKLQELAGVLAAISNGTFRQLPDGGIVFDGQGCN